MSCPYHKTAKQEEVPPSVTAAVCPFSGRSEHGGGDLTASSLPADAEMCSHARRKLEASRLQRDEEQQRAARPANDVPEYGTAAAAAATGGAANWTPEQLKAHFTEAYDSNALKSGVDCAARQSDAELSAILSERLGYTPEEIAVIGSDTRLMQGTGNPHRLAALVPGEIVVDLGSGFGIDAALASARVGPTGRVIGIDLSIHEVTSAIKRAHQRGLRNVDFRLGDIESPPIESATIDAVISNGGFCLVPNKPVAFAEIFRILKPGGRFSVSCTVRKKELDPTMNWPSCMVVFMPLDTVRDVLAVAGFSDVVIDEENSRMDTWDEKDKARVEENKIQHNARITIHRGDPQFGFLKAMDMNEYFARVNIFGRKPLSS